MLHTENFVSRDLDFLFGFFLRLCKFVDTEKRSIAFFVGIIKKV